MKTPEQLAVEWLKEEYGDTSNWTYMGQEMSLDAFYAGYQAAKDSACIDTNSIDSGTKMQWTSVKERLPEMEHGFAMRQESECVLIACNDNVHVAHLCEKWCDRTQLIFEACDCNCRGHDMEQDEWELDKVTHWMPLPKPPEEK